MTEFEVWQNLRALESFDNVKIWFNRIHHKDLNSRRTNEIICTARQAREYFKNAKQADYSVRSLLTFYGIASLSRATALLLRKNSGEEALNKGHGLEVFNWSEILSGEISTALSNLEKLQVKTCKGLFYDFLLSINNTTYMHTNGSNVNWSIPYLIPELEMSISLEDLLSRIPDLKNDASTLPDGFKGVVINDIAYTQQDGFKVKNLLNPPQSLLNAYQSKGYVIKETSKGTFSFEGTADLFNKDTPLFLHSYIHKMFGSIPYLYIVEPLKCGSNYCELSICYLLSYFMGMLSRYYPTHWVSLINGGNGDRLWPIINRAQNYVEIVFPELVIELIQEQLKE